MNNYYADKYISSFDGGTNTSLDQFLQNNRIHSI